MRSFSFSCFMPARGPAGLMWACLESRGNAGDQRWGKPSCNYWAAQCAGKRVRVVACACDCIPISWARMLRGAHISACAPAQTYMRVHAHMNLLLHAQMNVDLHTHTHTSVSMWKAFARTCLLSNRLLTKLLSNS